MFATYSCTSCDHLETVSEDMLEAVGGSVYCPDCNSAMEDVNG